MYSVHRHDLTQCDIDLSLSVVPLFLLPGGTTGTPKAVMLTHDNITWTCKTMILSGTPRGYLDADDIIISYLPLSHIAAQQLDMYMPAITGCQVYFASPDALKGSLAGTLKEVRPTVFFGVPRVWEKFYGKKNVGGMSLYFFLLDVLPGMLLLNVKE
jgi:acyl-CoA synthetase (AMP-forming)/AMP-acid ligase II